MGLWVTGSIKHITFFQLYVPVGNKYQINTIIAIKLQTLHVTEKELLSWICPSEVDESMDCLGQAIICRAKVVTSSKLLAFCDYWGLGALEIWNALFSIQGWWEEATGAEERLEHPAKGWVRLAGRPGTQNSGAACEIIFWVDTRVMGRFEVRVKPESAHFLFEAKVIDSLADFPGCWLNKGLPLPWNSMSGH